MLREGISVKRNSVSRKQAKSVVSRMLAQLGAPDFRVHARGVRGLCEVHVVRPHVKWPHSARQLLRPRGGEKGPCDRIIARGTTWLQACRRMKHVLLHIDARRAA
jgi:hypothetical protein